MAGRSISARYMLQPICALMKRPYNSVAEVVTAEEAEGVTFVAGE